MTAHTDHVERSYLTHLPLRWRVGGSADGTFMLPPELRSRLELGVNGGFPDGRERWSLPSRCHVVSSLFPFLSLTLLHAMLPCSRGCSRNVGVGEAFDTNSVDQSARHLDISTPRQSTSIMTTRSPAEMARLRLDGRESLKCL